MRSVFPLRLVAASWIVVTGCLAASADEGMWLFNDLPRDHLKADYDFDPTDQWARHVMRASVRVNSG
ncbi:MAG: S46 family peptidase, partial [Pirellulaceae bacterium]|nr:S46 family peptidase [Pirellulaceae bacterium]